MEDPPDAPLPESTSQDDLIEKDHAEDPAESSAESLRLGGKAPLPTIIALSAGPLMSQVAGALVGVINSIWIAQTLGDRGVTAVSTYNNFDTLGRAFAYFLQVSASTKISSLYGSGRPSEASQVFSDLLRLAVVCAVLAAVCFLPITKPIIRWFGASEDIADLGYEYIKPNLLGTIVPCVYLLGCGCLQSEGRSWLFAGTQIAAMVLNSGVFAPFFLFACKTGIGGVSYATLCGELIPAIVIVVLFYRGKFGIQPRVGDLLKMPSRESWEAIKIGFSQLLYQMSCALPGLFIRFYFGRSSKDETEFNDVMAAFNTTFRFWAVVASVANALAIGFLPAASFAFGAKRYGRILSLLIHATWMSIAWSAFSMIFTVAFPEWICMIFSRSEGYMAWAVFFERRMNYLAVLFPTAVIVNALLQSLQRGGLALMFCFGAQTLPLPLASSALYFTDKHDIPRLSYAFVLQFALAAAFAVPFIIFGIRQIWKRNDDVDNPELPLEEFDTDSRKEPLIAGDSPM
jgi:Na+-driven multidrug efflux pump